MNRIIFYFFMAVGLSVDAFTLAVIYGMNKICLKKMILLSLLVGLFHIVMPFLGSIVGLNVLISFIDKANFLAGVVFVVLAFEMFSSLKEEEKPIELSHWYQLLFFAFTVSLDSFSIGIVLSLGREPVLFAGSIFSIVSCCFTYFGLKLGRFVSKKYSDQATKIGAIILFIISLKYFFSV